MEEANETFWAGVAHDNEWPTHIYLRNIGTLPGFPLSTGGYRNLVSGKNSEPTDDVRYAGKYAFQTRQTVILKLAKWVPIRRKNIGE